MNDWRDLAGDWQAQSASSAPQGAELAALAARARREALGWRWKWRLVQASAVALVAFSGWFVVFASRPLATKALVLFLAALAVAAWLAARRTMDALVSIEAHSALDHLRAQRQRAAAMPMFVAIDFAVYGACALAITVATFDAWRGKALLGVDLAAWSTGDLLVLWGLLAAGVAYDVWRLRRFRRELRRIDAVLAVLGPDEPG